MEDLSMQIVEGIAQAVNGEGASEMMMEDIGIDKDGAITVLLADLPQDRLSELVAEVHDRISHWRVNPFSEVVYGGGRTLRFYLKPEDEIRRLYQWQQW
jgi:hypothetical protein